MPSLRLAAAGLAALSLGGALVAGELLPSAGAEPTKSQELFERILVADERTSAPVRDLLRSNGAFIARDVPFGDVTGDGRSDALVPVESGGAAGALALYVLSTHGQEEDSELRVVSRWQRLYRATARVDRGAIVLRTPRYARGDDLCCPKEMLERVYTWSERAQSLRRRSSRVVDGPVV